MLQFATRRPTAAARGLALAAALIGAAATIASLPASAQEGKSMTAAESDPIALGWMVGAPPPSDKIIRFSDPDYFSFPKLRWTVCHFRQLMPTVGVGRGLGPLRFFERAPDSGIDSLTFTPLGGDREMRFDDSLAANYTDDRGMCFGSLHTGGANFCFADGSVRFLSETLSLPNYQRMGGRNDGGVVLFDN